MANERLKPPGKILYKETVLNEFAPRIVVDYPPELLNLPYKVVINPDALREEMEKMGFEDRQICRTEIHINYQKGPADQGLDLLGIRRYGGVDLLTGVAFVNAGTIIGDAKKWTDEFSRSQEGLPPKRETLETIKRKIGRLILTQALPEMKKVEETQKPKFLSPDLARSYGEIACHSVKQADSEEKVQEIKKTWVAFLEDVVQRTIKYNLRMALSHELEHGQHHSFKEFVKFIAVIGPAGLLYLKTVDVVANQTIVMAQRLDIKIPPETMKNLITTIGIAGSVPVFLKIAWAIKEWLIIGEEEAYEAGANLVERFSKVISVEKIGS